jgi:hypothetical protein
MRGSRTVRQALLPLCLLLALLFTAASAQAAAAPASPPGTADAAFLQSLGSSLAAPAAGAAARPAPLAFLPAVALATCTCTQEMQDCRTLCTGNSCRPDFVCNVSNPCLSSCRCTHCV